MIIAVGVNKMTMPMTEYYELVLTHRVQDGGKCDPHLEEPIVVKGFISPLMQRSVEFEAEREVLIDEMCRKIKDCWMRTRKNGDGNE